VYAERNFVAKNDKKLRSKFFEKNQPCLRTSTLTKKYGWGIHFNNKGKAALYSKDSVEYINFEKYKNSNLKLIKALRNKKA